MANWIRGPIIGRGSSATVSLATAFPSGDLFAVKSAELSRSDLLQSEQRILSSLNCPQIISYLGFEVTTLHYNVFVEYAPGGSLSDHIKNQGGHLDEPTIRSYSHEMLTGLDFLHSRGMVHCDIKPQNILIGLNGQTKIADFGCSRWLNQADDITSYPVRGTPMFMAPEVARGEEQGPEADVWALGCTVLEMATGRPPWPQSDPVAALHRIAFSPVVPEIPSWLSDEVKDFLRKCFVRDSSQRSTADQLLKHSFVKICTAELKLNSNWSSPKSTLDQDFWETESSLEAEEHEVASEDCCRKRIRELEGSCHGGPNWTWDDNWTTIRSNTEGCSMISVAEGDNDEDESAVTSSQTNSTRDVGNLFFESHNNSTLDDDSVQTLEYWNGDEMQHATCCKEDLISFSDKNYLA